MPLFCLQKKIMETRNKTEEARRAVEVINASAQPGSTGDKDSKARILFTVCDCVTMAVLE